MRVLVAPDKFKGCLTAAEVAGCVADGLRDGGASAEELPQADGGDGSVAAALSAGYRPVTVRTVGATGEPREASIAVGAATAVVEVAECCGLGTLPGARPAPMQASSLGLGQAVAAAIASGPRRVVLALGGSASTDGGAGFLAGLGAVLRDAEGRVVEASGASLSRIACVELAGPALRRDVELVIASDVTNSLLGPHGAAAVYSPQKGADADQVAELEAGMARWVEVLAAVDPRARAWAEQPGAGSAGGIAFAALALGGTIVSGAELFLGLTGFAERARQADTVVTGEGRLDAQTLQGKLVAAVARRAAPTPVVAVAGDSELTARDEVTCGLAAVHTVRSRTTVDTTHDPETTRRVLREIGRTVAETR